MLQLANATIKDLLEWPRLIDAMEDAFCNGGANPPRQQHEIPVEGGTGGERCSSCRPGQPEAISA